LKRDPLVEIDVGIRGDTAAALGQAGRKLAAAIAALRAADAVPDARASLLHAAATALWSFIVQREAVGVTDHAEVARIYGVTPELWRRMGVSNSE